MGYNKDLDHHPRNLVFRSLLENQPALPFVLFRIISDFVGIHDRIPGARGMTRTLMSQLQECRDIASEWRICGLPIYYESISNKNNYAQQTLSGSWKTISETREHIEYAIDNPVFHCDLGVITENDSSHDEFQGNPFTPILERYIYIRFKMLQENYFVYMSKLRRTRLIGVLKDLERSFGLVMEDCDLYDDDNPFEDKAGFVVSTVFYLDAKDIHSPRVADIARTCSIGASLSLLADVYQQISNVFLSSPHQKIESRLRV